MIRSFFKLLIQFFVLAVIIFIGSVLWILTDGLFDSGDDADVAVVSGSGVRPDGVPGPTLRARLDGAVKFYEDGKFHLIIVSGATRGDFNEAKSMAKYLEAQKIPAAAIIQDPTGENNQATARAVAKIMKERNLRSVMIVSSYYCITRMQLALRHEGIVTTLHLHVGVPNRDDGLPLAREVIATYYDLIVDILVPGFDQLQKKAQEEAPKVKDALQKDVQKVQQDVHSDKH